MAHQSLYRRYRSQRFSEILGQPHVTNALRSAVAEGREGHAYLFSGPRGTGKTSTARVLAKALNCENLTDGEPCCACGSCRSIETGNSFDIHELDAASNNKVDDIRELIAKVHLGTPGRTKVYILDEVHMLSSGAENALLKTLEEPPAHVVFVLATTEPQKVVSTIRSRTQHFEFHLLPAEVLAEHVRWVIADAGLDVGEDAIDYALRQGGGSARDTLSALDLVAAAGGVPEGGDVAEQLVRAIGDRNPAAAIACIQEGLELGREPRTIGEDVLDLLRNAFLATMGAPLNHLNDRHRATATDLGQAIGAAGLTRALESIGQALVEMRQSPDPRVPLEVTVLRLARAATDPADTAGLLARIDALEARVAELESRPATAASPVAPSAGAPTPHTPARHPAPEAAAASGARGPAAAARDQLARPPRSPRSARAGATSVGADSPPPSRSAPARTAEPGGGASDPSPERAGSRSGPSPHPAHGSSDGPPPAPSRQPNPGTDSTPAPGTGTGTGTGTGGADPNAATSGSALTLTAVTNGWAPLLDSLSQRVRARFKGGRIIDVDAGTIRFGVPNAIARDRCLQVTNELEQGILAQFGQPARIEVVIDDDAVAPTDPARIEPRPVSNQPPDLDEDIGPVSELADATDQSANSIERLTRAFPGSQVIEG